MYQRSILADMLYENASLYPHKDAIVCDGKSLTYNELAQFISRYSNLLLKAGLRYGDHIAIPMNNSIESVALFFSAADLGACVVPLNPSLPAEAFKKALIAGDVKHVIARKSFFINCDDNGEIKIPGFSICLDSEYKGTIPFAQIDEMPSYRPAIDHNITGEESLILTMTSGSTGTPKPIDLSQENKLERAMAHIRAYKISKDERVFVATPLYHSLAERLVILPLIWGGTVILLPRYTPTLWLKCVAEQKPTFTIAVSAQLAQILETIKKTDASSITSFRSIVSSSALLDETVKDELIKILKCEFHEMYGASEISTVTDICFQESSMKRKSVGKPFDEASIRILHNMGEQYSECALGCIGEIAVKSKLQCKGYYKKNLELESAITDGYFRTGDLGYLDEDGYLYFSGRKKELIITGGVNVYPQDIDEVVKKLSYIEECAAFAYPDVKLGEVVALAVIPKKEHGFDLRSLKSYCAKNLADFQQPHKIFIVESLPRNSMGKLQRGRIIDFIDGDSRLV